VISTDAGGQGSRLHSKTPNHVLALSADLCGSEGPLAPTAEATTDLVPVPKVSRQVNDFDEDFAWP
jgi:FAD/FMN-containing dehydrogenase